MKTGISIKTVVTICLFGLSLKAEHAPNYVESGSAIYRSMYLGDTEKDHGAMFVSFNTMVDNTLGDIWYATYVEQMGSSSSSSNTPSSGSPVSTPY